MSPATTLVLSSVSGVEITSPPGITSPPPTSIPRLDLAFGPPYRPSPVSWKAALATRSIASAIWRICTAALHLGFVSFAIEVLIGGGRAAREEVRHIWTPSAQRCPVHAHSTTATFDIDRRVESNSSKQPEPRTGRRDTIVLYTQFYSNR